MSADRESLDAIAREIRQRIAAAADQATLEQLRVEALGKKGRLTAALRSVGTLPPEQRAAAGARSNALKTEVEALLASRAEEIQDAQLGTLAEREWIDVSFVPSPVRRGHLHPLTLILREVKAIFSSLGYEVALGPQVEDEFHNFEALNIPAEHPARDTMDSFYLEQGRWLLRTHTSPVQIRYMQSHQPPIRIIAPGAVYRRDATDPSHGSQFNQVEGLVVDRDIRLSDLKGTIEYFARSLFGADRRIRIVGDHFPFTEPSIGAAVSCGLCGGKGCRSCKAGWLEILGAGMVHPQVLRNGGIDPERYSGFAFGAGLDRLAMLKYNVSDLRLFLDNDVRFLRQF
ncbi:MAG TPA: phenylalanine--tRNA ligase subunit alpha [Candidatus Dormibacteraeota bacterium]|jgi:phenylalanyl-tRNA synthetase alpha chain|nr:phenylalanine--tRNA ligase subunit alpha [Candidatus Dormibacteraeota bacterium]